MIFKNDSTILKISKQYTCLRLCQVSRIWCVSSQVTFWRNHIGSLKSEMIQVFAPWKLGCATEQNFFIDESIRKYLLKQNL